LALIGPEQTTRFTGGFDYSIKIFSKTLKKIKIFFDRFIEKMLNMHSEE
jgi:hypothetical protein